MSRAYDPDAPVEKVDAPLTNWLTNYLNELAGKPLSAGPLTFGDLYRSPRPPGDPEPDGPEYKAINLEMMTTGLNHGRPYRLPFRDPDRLFYFSAEEFETLFPPSVVKYMVDHAPQRGVVPPHAAGCERLYAFADPHDLPVVVATRMSLSFPGPPLWGSSLRGRLYARRESRPDEIAARRALLVLRWRRL